MWFIKLQGRFVSFNILTFTCGYMNFAQSRRNSFCRHLQFLMGNVFLLDICPKIFQCAQEGLFRLWTGLSPALAIAIPTVRNLNPGDPYVASICS
jgi:hypothetical protein